MWFRNVFLKTLRDFRIGIFGWGIGTGLLIFIVLESFPALVATAQARASLVALSQSFAWLSAPIRVDTAGGYATFKYGSTILLVAIWALSAGTRVLRGEEERGSLDVLLALPRPRFQVAFQKVAAIWAALLAMAVITAVIVYGGGRSVQAAFSFGDAVLFSVNIALTAAVFAGLALVVSQFTQERGSAAGLTGGLLVLAIVLDMVHRIFPNAEWISQLSPVYYYNLNKPLVPGYSINAVGLLVLLALGLLLTSAGLALFMRRDVGGTVRLPWVRPRPQRASSRALPVNDWSVQSVYARGLAMVARPTVWWTLGIAGFAVWMIVVLKQTETQLMGLFQGSPILKGFLGTLGGNNPMITEVILGALFFFLPVALMVFAVTQTNRWAADEEEGRLELLLATPQPRLRVLLARYAALTTATIIIALVTLLVTWIAASTAGIGLDNGHLVAACLTMVPVGLLVAALGYLFAGWLRTAIDTGLLSLLVALWVFISLIGPDLKFPDGVLRISPMYYYGNPLLNGLNLANTVGLLVAAAIALAIASARFVRKDIAV